MGSAVTTRPGVPGSPRASLGGARRFVRGRRILRRPAPRASSRAAGRGALGGSTCRSLESGGGPLGGRRSGGVEARRDVQPTRAGSRPSRNVASVRAGNGVPPPRGYPPGKTRRGRLGRERGAGPPGPRDARWVLLGSLSHGGHWGDNSAGTSCLLNDLRLAPRWAAGPSACAYQF